MESGKNNRNEEMLDDYIGYKLTTENSFQSQKNRCRCVDHHRDSHDL